MNKVIKDGKVAVIISSGYGSGFSSWLYGFSAQELVFNPIIVNKILLGEVITPELLISLYPKLEGGYIPDLSDLEIEWVPTNKRFFIDEYDGNESVVMEDSINWLIGEESNVEASLPHIHMGNTEFKGIIYTMPDGSKLLQEPHLKVKDYTDKWLNQKEVEKA